jgi:hypothetical protein
MADDASAVVALRYRPKALNELAPYIKNSKRHSPAQITALERSLVEFGWTRPIMEADGTILAGHGMVAAAISLARRGGCPLAWPDPWVAPTVDLSHLNENQRRAYVIADNRLSEMGAVDEDTRIEEMGLLASEGFDLTLLGFSLPDLDKLLAQDPLDPRQPDPKHPLSAHTCPSCGHQWTDET